MNTLSGTWDWFTTAANWTGADGIPTRLLQHLGLTVISLVIAAAIALPGALWLGHTGRGGFAAINISNVGRAIPTFAILVIFATIPALGFGNKPTVIALVLFAIPPILTNSYVGMREVDPEIREAATGMGMTGRQVLLGVEVPLALPLIAAGIRTAAVQVVATATIAAYVGGGGLGRFIVDGFGRQDTPMLVGGAILVALFAFAVEVLLGRLQRRLEPGARAPRQPQVPAEGQPEPGAVVPA
jgi:osmoprotectant transport system permease protein